MTIGIGIGLFLIFLVGIIIFRFWLNWIEKQPGPIVIPDTRKRNQGYIRK